MLCTSKAAAPVELAERNRDVLQQEEYQSVRSKRGLMFKVCSTPAFSEEMYFPVTHGEPDTKSWVWSCFLLVLACGDTSWGCCPWKLPSAPFCMGENFLYFPYRSLDNWKCICVSLGRNILAFILINRVRKVLIFKKCHNVLWDIGNWIRLLF